jgi:phosphoadenosine phosphosulfate reductase
MTIDATLPRSDLEELARRFESWSAHDVVAWGIETFGPELSVAASMADTVLVHLATCVDPDVEIVFLDTGFHFAETIETLRRSQARYRLNLHVERPRPDAPDLFEVGTEQCCAARKVALLDRALAGKRAWMTGLRRAEATTRTSAPIVSLDTRGLVKLCPIATWTDEQVQRYAVEHQLVVNPLQQQGYPSIGCWPCTEPVLDGGDARSGRWAGTGKTECGLHR